MKTSIVCVMAAATAWLAGGCATPMSADAAASPVVAAILETPPVGVAGDSADDPAIWVAPVPTESLVVATQKKGGLMVYDLEGRLVQEAPGGLPNNVDLRDGFSWKQGLAPIVGAGDRSDNTLVFWRLDPATRRLDPAPALRAPTGFVEVYGFCLGRQGDHLLAAATDRDSGNIGVWRIAPSEAGGVGAERIMSFSLGSITEGCVFDDARGILYLADELNGVWSVPLNSADGAGRARIDSVAPAGRLAADVEGLSIWAGANGGGYLVVSVQGENRYVVYDLAPPNAWRGSFRIGASADGKADAVTGTDGIDVSSAALGPAFPRGLMVAQDDVNSAPSATQNFKYVSWADVAASLGLE